MSALNAFNPFVERTTQVHVTTGPINIRNQFRDAGIIRFWYQEPSTRRHVADIGAKEQDHVGLAFYSNPT